MAGTAGRRHAGTRGMLGMPIAWRRMSRSKRGPRRRCPVGHGRSTPVTVRAGTCRPARRPGGQARSGRARNREPPARASTACPIRVLAATAADQEPPVGSEDRDLSRRGGTSRCPAHPIPGPCGRSRPSPGRASAGPSRTRRHGPREESRPSSHPRRHFYILPQNELACGVEMPTPRGPANGAGRPLAPRTAGADAQSGGRHPGGPRRTRRSLP